MGDIWKLHRRLADISNIDLEHSCKPKFLATSSKTPETARCVVLTASGFHGAAKQELQRLAASIGATYSGDLILGTTTHLICKRLIDCFGSAKYQRALQWGVHIVTYDWLKASSAAGKPLPEQNYKDDQLQSLEPSPKPVKRQQRQARNDCKQLVACKQQTAESGFIQQSGRAGDLCGQQPHANADADGNHEQLGCRTPVVAKLQQQRKPEQPQEQLSQPLPQHTQQEQQKVLLEELPDDFLLQGSEPEDTAADPAAHDAGQDASAFSFSLSQYSVQQQQEYNCRQQLQTADLSKDKLNRHHVPPAAAAGDAVFGFGQLTATAAEHTSPCMQHFVPMQPQQEALLTVSAPPSLNITSSELQPEGIFNVQPGSAAAAAPAPAAISPVQRISICSPSSSLAGSEDSQSSLCSLAAAAAGSPVSPVASVISAISAEEGEHEDSPIGLLIPETQAELEDPWGSAAAGGDTPVSLKYYATQHRSRTHAAAAQIGNMLVTGVAGFGASSGAHSAAAAAVADCHEEEQQQQEDNDVDDDEESLPNSEAADDTEVETADDTADPTEASSEELEAVDDDTVLDAEPVARPWSGSSSTAHAERQQQQPEFRLTQPSGSDGGSSRRSSGLTRLRRRDGYRRLGRVLVSELPSPSNLELQDSDCEGDCENNCELDCEVQEQGAEDDSVREGALDDDVLEDSDCEDMQEPQRANVLQQQQPQQRRVQGNCMQAAVAAGKRTSAAAVADSPVHSCTASSLPALSGQVAVISRGGQTGSNRGTTRHTATAAAATPAADTPAASAVSGTGSGAEMPVMKLKFSLSHTTDVTISESGQQDDSVYTPGCSYLSSEYSPCTGTADADPSAGLGEEWRYTPEVQQQREPQQQQVNAADGEVPEPLLAPSTFITRRRGGRVPLTPQQQQQQQGQQLLVPSAAALLGQVFVKQEPEDVVTAQQWQQQQQQQYLPAAANPADAMLRALKQQQQQIRLKPAPIKKERLTPAEHLLQDLRQRQQELQHEAQVASNATEGIDDEADSQGAAASHLHQQQQQQQQRIPRNSVASYATDISTMSRKVPLKVCGGHEKIVGGESVAAEGLPGSTTPLERLLQATLATRCDTGAATASASGVAAVAVKQEPVDWLHTPEGDASRAADPTAAAAAAAAAGGADSEDDAFEITELPTGVVAARNRAMTKQLDAHLAHLSQATGDQVIPLKMLAKAPRGSTAKSFHGLRNSSKLVYADQVQIPWAHATLSTKEKSRCVIVADKVAAAVAAAGQEVGAAAAAIAAAAAASSDDQHKDKVFVAEPVAFYKLETGDWWLELLRFHSTKELRLLAKAADCKLHLPADFHLSYELLRGMTHEHVPLRLVQGEFKLSKVKKVPSSSRSRANPFFWRYSIDAATCQVLTDRPVADYVMQ